MQNDSDKPVETPAPSTEIKPETASVPTVPAPEPDKPADSMPSNDTVTTDKSADTPVSPVDKPKSKMGKLWLVVVLIIVIAAVGGAAFYKHHNTTKHAAATSAKKDIPLLNYGFSGTDLSTLYPAGTNTEGANLVDAQLFEGLVRYQSQTKIVPLLATGWTNPNDTDWVFTLHSGVKFHNGDTLTATDVKYSLDYAVAHQNDNDGATLMSLANTIKTVTVMSPSQVKITTDGPDPTLLNRLASLYIIDSKAKVGDPDAGTGPYMLKTGTSPTASDVYLTASNDYWDGHVYTRAIHFGNAATPAALATATTAGTFDLSGPLPEASFTKLHASKDIPVQDISVYFLGLNTLKKGSPLTSLAARQAIGYALDIPAIVKAADADGQQVNQLIPSTFPGYDSSLPTIPYNVAKAKALLAGVANLSAPLTVVYASNHAAELTEIAKELDAVGFNIKLQSEPDIGTVVSTGLGGKADMFYVAYGSDILDGLDVIQSVVIGNANYSSTTVEGLADKASATIDPASRISLLQQIEKQVAADVPDVPLFVQTNHYALTKPYQNVTVDIPSSEIGTYFWKVSQ